MTDKTLKFERKPKGESSSTSRLPIPKTYKIYIDGKFPRTESGRYYSFESQTKDLRLNLCRCSRKDVRDAVTSARNAQSRWAKATAYLRGQILYRVAEILEGRKTQFLEELGWQGTSQEEAEIEVNTSIDRLIYFAGWADKYQQIFSSVNPVTSSHFNFSILEPTGVVGIVAPEKHALLGFVSMIAPTIVGGNTCIVIAPTQKPLTAVTFAEVLQSSDLPAGVVNILTGYRSELLKPLSSHMDVNSILTANLASDEEDWKEIQTVATLNIKRLHSWNPSSWIDSELENPYRILDTQEVKTTWHPVGI